MNNCPKYYKCPPLMSDRRFGTDYRPNCYTHHSIFLQNNLLNSHEMREFMIKNGNKLRHQNYVNFMKNYQCPNTAYSNPDPFDNDKHWEKFKKHINFDKLP